MGPRFSKPKTFNPKLGMDSLIVTPASRAHTLTSILAPRKTTRITTFRVVSRIIIIIIIRLGEEVWFDTAMATSTSHHHTSLPILLGRRPRLHFRYRPPIMIPFNKTNCGIFYPHHMTRRNFLVQENPSTDAFAVVFFPTQQEDAAVRALASSRRQCCVVLF